MKEMKEMKKMVLAALLLLVGTMTLNATENNADGGILKAAAIMMRT